jgi:antitoxin MazE
MVTRIQKWGNSQGLRISRDLLAEAGLQVGDDVDVSLRDGLIVVAPVRRIRGGRDLADLVRRIPAGHEPGEVDWGKPAGDEVW